MIQRALRLTSTCLPLFNRRSTVLSETNISPWNSRPFTYSVLSKYPMAEDDGQRPTKRSKIEHGSSPTATTNDDVMRNDDTAMAREPESSGSSAVAVEHAPAGQPGKGKKRDASGWAKSRRGKESDKKNVGRKRRGTRNDEASAEGAEGAGEGRSVAPKGPRYPKRQCALLLSFCGTGCSGMQMYDHFVYYSEYNQVDWCLLVLVNRMRGRLRVFCSMRSSKPALFLKTTLTTPSRSISRGQRERMLVSTQQGTSSA